MKLSATRRQMMAASALLLTGPAAWALQHSLQLKLNGQVVSTDVQVIGNRTYIPLADVAKALNMTVVKTAAGYELTPAGGANQLQGVTGKQGDNIFSGEWTFKVISVSRVDKYTPQFNKGDDPAEPKVEGDNLVVVQCRLKNATHDKQTVYFYRDLPDNTVITDGHEHSYGPLYYDSHNSEQTADDMLPGSAHDFAIVFSVPKDVKIQDLIFTADSTNLNKHTDFRVALNP